MSSMTYQGRGQLFESEMGGLDDAWPDIEFRKRSYI